MDWTNLTAATLAEALATSTFLIADEPNVIANGLSAFKKVDVTTLKRLFGSPDIQVFTSSGTWTKPLNAQVVDVMVVGGGGGGGSGRRGAAASGRAGGASGAPGVITRHRIEASMLGSTETVTIGAGGAGGGAQSADSTDGNAGTNGAASLFGILQAVGGNAGAGGNAAGGAAGGTAKSSSILIYNCVPGNSAAGAIGGLGSGLQPTATTGHQPTAGGSGGGISAGDVVFTGGAGGNIGPASNLLQAGPTTPGDAGILSIYRFGTGGAGGSASNTANAQAGGAGAGGGGGGGGGASLNSFLSGAGGAGGNGLVVVITT